MKVGDYVARIKDLQKPDEMEPIGLIVKKRTESRHIQFWEILTANDGIEVYSEKYLEVLSEGR